MKTNVKIWIYWNNGYVKINLKSGQEINLTSYTETEEGYAGESMKLYYSAVDGIIERTIYTEGRDCDGRSSSEQADICPVDKIQACGYGRKIGRNGDFVNDYNVRRPQWTSIKSAQYDQYAEIAGY